MKLAVFLLVSLLQIRITQGSAAESKFVKLGADVGLDIKKPVAFTVNADIFYWKFNSSNIFRSENKTNNKTYPNYDGRVVVLENFSLVLKNVQEPDAGPYTAVIIGEQNNLAEYQLHIQAEVSPVKLEVVSLFADSDSCNLTVTCRTDKTHLNATFECRYANCTAKDGGELSNADWHLVAFILNSSIVCRHSNQVSEMKEAKALQQVCRQHVPKESSVFTWIWICTPLVIGLTLALIFALRRRKRQATRKPEGRQEINLGPNVDANDIDNGTTPNSTYSLVGHHKGPGETMYAQVLRPAKLPKMPEVDPKQVTGQNNSNPLLAL